MSIALKFADLTLDDVESWEEQSPSRIAVETFPRRHGSLVQPIAFLGPRVVRLNGRVIKSSEATLKSYFEDLNYKLYRKGRDKLYFYDDNRYLNAIKSGLSKGAHAQEAPGIAARFSIDFTADDPFWYSTVEQASALQSVVASPHTFSITNNGKAETPPRVEIKASDADKTDVKLTNTTIGLFMRFAGTILNGKTLIIRVEPHKIVDNSGSNGLNDFTGSFWYLEPGVNNLTYEGPTSVEIRVYWTERWA